MTDHRQSRKSFLKRIGASLAAVAVVSKSSAFTHDFLNDSNLSIEQKEFLQTYEQWLGQFHSFVKQQQVNFADKNNNMKLMQLSAEAEEWKTHLQSHMDDRVFADYHSQITQSVTNDIA